MSAQLTLRSLPPAAIKAMLDDGTELALIDVREELTFARAIKALIAQSRFAHEKSPDMPDLPLNAREDSPGTFKWQSARHYLVEAYNYSLRSRDYRLEGHPDFETFARGVMASQWTPEQIRNDAELLRRFPPKPLPGLGRGLVFKSR
jgi:hypothetical protein